MTRSTFADPTTTTLALTRGPVVRWPWLAQSRSAERKTSDAEIGQRCLDGSHHHRATMEVWSALGGGASRRAARG